MKTTKRNKSKIHLFGLMLAVAVCLAIASCECNGKTVETSKTDTEVSTTAEKANDISKTAEESTTSEEKNSSVTQSGEESAVERITLPHKKL